MFGDTCICIVALFGSRHGVAICVEEAATMPLQEKLQLLEDIAKDATACKRHLVRSAISEYSLVQNLTRFYEISKDDEAHLEHLDEVERVGAEQRAGKRTKVAEDRRQRRLTLQDAASADDASPSDTDAPATPAGSVIPSAPTAGSDTTSSAPTAGSDTTSSASGAGPMLQEKLPD